MLLFLWLFGIIGTLLPISVGWRRMRALRRQSVPVTKETQTQLLEQVAVQFHLNNTPQLRSSDVPTPLLIGIRRPMILLPTALADKAPLEELRWIFAHELAHLQRRDMLWGWVFLLTRSLFFFHPGVWLTYREWRIAQEIACDAMVVQIMQAPSADYAQMLVTLATQRNADRLENSQALGVLDAYQALERRLRMLKHLRTHSPRQAGMVGLILALSAVLCVIPWRVTAQSDTSPDKNVRLAQQWEDVLLLEALDYLRLSPKQYEEMLSMAQFAHTRLADAEQQQEKTRARLEDLVQHQRNALLEGKPPSSSEQAEALDLEHRMFLRQEPAMEEIVNRLTPRMARLLTRKQMYRVWLLAMGETPQGEISRTALLHSNSGFVLDGSTEFQWKEEQVSYALHQRYSEPEIKAAHRGGASHEGMLKMLGFGLDEEEAANLPELSDEMCETIRHDEGAIRNRIDATPDLYLNQANPDQLGMVLRPFVRRLFLSARLEPALTERLHKRDGSAPSP